MRKYMSIVLPLFISMFVLSGYQGFEADATICHSVQWEQTFRDLAGGGLEILAVCHKDGYFIVEISGEEDQITLFKQLTWISNLRVTSIEELGESLKTGAKLLKMEYSY